MRILNVAEKPSMARQITTLLSGDDFDSSSGRNKYCRNFIFSYNFRGQPATMVMTSVLGHIKQLEFGKEYSDWHRVPYVELFSAPVTSSIPEAMQDVAENLRVEAQRSQILIIWTDCDREGEYIGSEVSQICLQANHRLDVYRARYSVLNASEMHRTMGSLSRLDLNQATAAHVRSELDLRSGAAFTRLQTIAFQGRQSDLKDKVISYGSCQFPTLGFVVEQYLKIQRFVPEDFWSLQLDVNQEGKTTKFVWRRNRLFDKAICTILYERCMEQRRVRIVRVESKPTSKWRPLPLRTVELQKLCSRFLRMSSDRVMEMAEKLYNRGYISYPRTETDIFEGGFDLFSLFRRQTAHPVWGGYAQRLLDGAFKFPRPGKNNDKAHPPIHPTKDGADLVGVEAKLYEFITRRFLACCSDDAKGLETVVLARLEGGEEFRARGVMVQALNYLEVYTYENWNDHTIGVFQSGQVCEPSRLEMVAGTTVAPKLLSESELIGTMDKNGIGTDATIHEHIKKIIERSYVIKNAEARFHPTNLGLSLVTGYDQVGLDQSLTKPKLRAMLEADLTCICDGRKSKDQVLGSMVQLFRESLLSTLDKIDILHQTMAANRQSGLFEPAPLPHHSTDRPSRGTGGGADGGGDGPEDRGGGPRRAPAPALRHQGRVRAQERSPDRGPECACGKASSQRTTKKPGPNMGRSFWTCPQCNFFAWAGGDENREPDIAAPRPALPPRERRPSSVVCDCQVPAVRRTVVKEGPNCGRGFYSCGQARESKCAFFLWEGGDGGGGERGGARFARPESRFTHNIKCQCDMVAIREQAKNGPSAGRFYLRCSKTVKRCGFFEWEDEGRGGRISADPPAISVTCYRCGQTGHFANACPAEAEASYAAPPPRGKRGRGGSRGAGRARGGSARTGGRGRGAAGARTKTRKGRGAAADSE